MMKNGMGGMKVYSGNKFAMVMEIYRGLGCALRGVLMIRRRLGRGGGIVAMGKVSISGVDNRDILSWQ